MRGTVTGRVFKLNEDGSDGGALRDVQVMLMIPRPSGPFITDITDENGVYEAAIRLDNASQKPMLVFGEKGFPPAVQTIDFSGGLVQTRDLPVLWRQFLRTKASARADILVDEFDVARRTGLEVIFRTADTSIEIVSMDPLKEGFKFGPITNDMTVSLVAGAGTYDDEGHMEVDLKLSIDNTNGFVGDATLDITMKTTGEAKTADGPVSGAPLSRSTRRATLVGSAPVKGSFLDGKTLSAALDVRFDDLPLPFLRA